MQKISSKYLVPVVFLLFLFAAMQAGAGEMKMAPKMASPKLNA